MKFKLSSKIVLFSFLIILNLILRLPLTPHEIGWDTFHTHNLMNSVSEFGYAKWWVNFYSIFGMYPYSYASGGIFLLSGIQQLTNYDGETVIFLFNAFLAVLSIFFSYILAKKINNDDCFKFLVAFVFSTSQGILTLTTWQGSTRSTFIIMFILLLYLLFKYVKYKDIRILYIIILYIILLASIHHLFYFALIVVLAFFAIDKTFKKINKYLKDIFSLNLNNSYLLSFIILILYIFMFFIPPFLMKSLITTGGRYEGLFISIKIYARYFGLLLIFAFGGLFYLIFNKRKKFEEWIIVLTFLILTPLIWEQTYSEVFMLIFLSILTGISLLNLAKLGKYNNILHRILVLCLISSIIFSALFQTWNPGTSVKDNYNERYAEESTYQSALWVKDYIQNNMTGVGLDQPYKRISAISGKAILTGEEVPDFINGFNHINESNIIKISPFSLDFYKENPYVLKYGGERTSGQDLRELAEQTADSNFYTYYKLKMNVSYAIENQKISTKFYQSLPTLKNKIYENGKIRFWDLN